MADVILSVSNMMDFKVPDIFDEDGKQINLCIEINLNTGLVKYNDSELTEKGTRVLLFDENDNTKVIEKKLKKMTLKFDYET